MASGILFAFIAFNTAAAIFLYWLARVPKQKKEKKDKEEKKEKSKE